MSQSTRRGLTFTREQVEEWIGHCITDDELEELERVLPYSSLPNCVRTWGRLDSHALQGPPQGTTGQVGI